MIGDLRRHELQREMLYEKVARQQDMLGRVTDEISGAAVL